MCAAPGHVTERSFLFSTSYSFAEMRHAHVGNKPALTLPMRTSPWEMAQQQGKGARVPEGVQRTPLLCSVWVSLEISI